MFCAQQCASRHWFLRSAEPDIHLQSRAPKRLHQRLSLYSLPVPKQFVESLGRVISFAQSATCRTWQSAHFVHPVSFGSILCCRSPAFFRRHEVSLLPIHGKQIRYHLPRYGKCRPISISFFAFPGHKSQPFHGSVSAPTWRLLPAHAEYVYCAASTAAYASPCRPSSVHLRTGRSS